MNDPLDKIKRRVMPVDQTEQRLTRIETKLSAMMYALGLDTHGKPLNHEKKTAAIKRLVTASHELVDCYDNMPANEKPPALAQYVDELDTAASIVETTGD